MTRFLLYGALTVLLGTQAQAMNAPGNMAASQNAADSQTVNDYSNVQLNQARNAATEAGYIPAGVQMAQAGNIFLTATHNGEAYTVLVTPDKEVYASTPVPLEGKAMASNNSAPQTR